MGRVEGSASGCHTLFRYVYNLQLLESLPSFFIRLFSRLREKLKLNSIGTTLAVKSSYDRRLLHTLADCGAGFDCASAEEIELILSMGISAERIIFTHPCKPLASLGWCRKLGVSLITFDNECELRKLKDHYPEAGVVLRIFADDPTDKDPLGTKFGASRQDFQGLVRLVKELGMRLAGASFHAGMCINPDFPASAWRTLLNKPQTFSCPHMILRCVCTHKLTRFFRFHH